VCHVLVLLPGGRNSSVAINISVYTFFDMQRTPSGILCSLVLKLSSMADKGMPCNMIYRGFIVGAYFIKLMGRLSKRIQAIVLLLKNIKLLLRHCLSISKDFFRISALIFMLSSSVEVG
jgi:hypothetical protein